MSDTPIGSCSICHLNLVVCQEHGGHPRVRSVDSDRSIGAHWMAVANRAEMRVARLREALGWIVNASGMSDLDDYYQFVDEHARAALRETEPGK